MGVRAESVVEEGDGESAIVAFRGGLVWDVRGGGGKGRGRGHAPVLRRTRDS